LWYRDSVDKIDASVLSLTAMDRKGISRNLLITKVSVKSGETGK